MNIDAMIKENTGIIYKVMNEFYIKPSDKEDYFSIGLVGLWKAIETYQKDKGFAFSTYAYTVIRKEFWKEISYRNAKKRNDANIYCSIDQNVSDGEGKEMSYSNLIMSEEKGYTNIQNKMEIDSIFEEFGAYLSEREKMVLSYYLQSYSFRDIADSEGITQQSVNQSFNHAIEKLKALIEGKDLPNVVRRGTILNWYKKIKLKDFQKHYNKKLSKKESDVILCYYQNNYNARKVSESLNIPLNTVRSILRKVVKKNENKGVC